jgi:hypothetical protein
MKFFEREAMSSFNTFVSNMRGILCALTVTALLAADVVTARVLHQGHNMQSMPGMKMSKPKAKAKAKRKSKSKGRSTMRRKRSAHPSPKKTDMHGMDVSMHGMHGGSNTLPSGQPQQ